MRWIGLLVFLVACGEVKAKPDGGGGGGDDDSGVVDASPDGPEVGEATVAVTLDGVAQSGVRVNFQASDGSLTTEAMTDTNGVATGTVHADAMVTVAIGPNDLVTVTGVNPGDDVVLKDTSPFDDTSVTTAAFGAASEAANKAYYRADVGEDWYVTATSITSGTRELDVPRSVLDATNQFYLVAGVYDLNNKLIAYSFTKRSPSSSGTTSSTVPTPWRTDVVDLSTSISDAPAGATKLSVESNNEQSGILYMRSTFPAQSPYPGQAPIANGTATVIVPYLGGFGEYVHTRADLQFGTSGGTMTFIRRVSRPASAFAITSADFPARVSSTSVDSSTPTRPMVTWTIDGSTASGDAISVDLSWRDPTAASYRWHLYLPPDATTVTFPEVSASIAAQAPAQSSTVTSAEVAEHCLEPLSGYAAFHLSPPLDFTSSTRYGRMPLGFNTWFYSAN